MKEVNFYKGPSGRYNQRTHGDGIYFATDTLEILVDGLSYGSVEVDDILTEIGENPVKGNAIYKAIKDTVKDSIDNAPFGAKLKLSVSGNNVYLLYLLDKNNNIISLTDEFYGDSTGTQDPSGIKFSLLSGNQQVKEGTKVYIDLQFDVKDLSGNSMGRVGQFSLMRDSETNVVYKQELQPGQSRIEITDYIQEDLTKFWVEVEAETLKGTEKMTGYFTVQIVNISIDTTYDISKTIMVGDTLTIPVLVQGIYGPKYVRAYLNGKEVNPDVDPYNSASGTTTVEIPTKDLSHGTHNIQLRADYEANDSTIYSNIIYLDLIIKLRGVTKPLFACRFDYENGDYLISGTNRVVNVSQYDPFLFQYYVWAPESNKEVQFYSEGVNISNENISETAAVINYRYIKSGVKNCFLEYQGNTYNFLVNVKKSSYQIVEPTTGMQLYLDAFGKSNNSAFRDVWEYKNITSTFENFNWTDDGWTGKSLKLFNGSKVTINHKPFLYSSGAIGAMSFTIRFKISRAVDPNEVVISCIDEYGYGLKITSQEATLITKGGTISTKFAEDLIYTLGIVSFPEALPTSIDNLKNNSRMCYLYIDGIISKGFPNEKDIYQGNPQVITLQANSCELEVYSIRSYNAELGDDEMFDCYLIDLADSEKLTQEYEQNDILSGLGIDINKIAGKIPYFIITGVSDKEAYTLLDYISMIKDKDTKYPVSSILYVDDKDPSFNFIALPTAEPGEKLTKSNSPYIRCLGTSSMGYPRKNYRIYTDKSKLYLGCDSNGKGGVLQDEPVYSITSSSIPVDCWCLKADYAESSSSHNTGTAALVEEVFNNAGLLTPAQSNKNPEYPYQIRTTVEGKPCLVFHRKYETDTPIFAGKYNFNNDKSTENVFGFCNIPGYHDENAPFAEERIEQCKESLLFPEGFTAVYYKEVDDEIVLTDASDKDADIATKEELLKIYENNPTECWEFLNNTSEMGNFLRSDFTEIDPKDSRKFYWTTTWESRFPGEDALTAAYLAGVQPYYLKNTAEWITSTNISPNNITNKTFDAPIVIDGVTFTKDTAEYRLAKFRSELQYYFDINYLCAYYMITECLAAADQRVKNMMWGFWYDPKADEHDVMHKMRCYPIFYDNDTILGLDNSGVLRINWDADENTLGVTGGYVFAGHDSTIWNNLRSEFGDRLEVIYKKLRNSNMTNTLMFKHYNINLSDKYCEKIYNKDAFYKYIIPEVVGIPYTVTGKISKFKGATEKMDGSRKAHRSWFIENRMSKYDAMYNSGEYTSSYIKLKSDSPPFEKDEKASILIITHRDWYYQLYDGSESTIIGHKKATPDKPLELALNEGRTLVQGDVIYLYGVKWAKELDLSNWGAYLELEFTGLMPVLEKLILGSHRPSAEVPIPLDDKVPALKYLDITNVKATSLDLRGCSKLETLLAKDSDLTTVHFAKNSNVNYIELPSSLVTLSLIGLPKLKNTGIIADYKNLLELRLENTDSLDRMALLNDILDKGKTELYVRITDLKLSGDGADLKFYKSKNLKGLSANGTYIEECALTGEYKLTTMLPENEYNELVAYFPYLDIQLPKYTHIIFNYKQDGIDRITNTDNNSGFNTPNPYDASGHISKILEKRYPCMVKIKDPLTGELDVMKLSDSDSYLYSDGGKASLSGDLGEYCMYEPNYWYKGVNDHINQEIHLFISSEENQPTESQADIITVSDCEVTPKTSVFTSSLELRIDTDDTCNSYFYKLPEVHNYKLFRVCSTDKTNTGAVVVDKDNKIISRLSATASSGMYNESYLFAKLPENAYGIYFTMNITSINNNCLYLISSEDKEAIEPEWVKHELCFIGRLLSNITDSSVMSAYRPRIMNDSNNEWLGSVFYAQMSENSSALCKAVNDKSAGCYPMGYEEYKDIIVLSYLKYGTTGLHINSVGAGKNRDIQYATDAKYIINGDYFKLGTEDTKVNTKIPYSSYQKINEEELIYPQVVTLLGYHQFIGKSSTISMNDKIDTDSMRYEQYLNNNLVRSLRIYTAALNSTSTNYVRYILGGKHFDLFTTGLNADGASSAFCGILEHNGSPVYLSLGGTIDSDSKAHTYKLNLVPASPRSYTSAYSMKNLVRIVFKPSKINEFTDSTSYINA